MTQGPITKPTHIHVWNREGDALEDDYLDALCHALHQQVTQDAGPAWGFSSTVSRVRHPDDVTPRGILAICQRSIPVPGAAGYHTVVGKRPEIVVSKEFVDSIGMEFPLVLSHEVLEVLGDRQCNHWIDDWLCELGDPVQRQGYDVAGFQLSNFVLPAWFQDDAPGPYDFLGNLTAPHQIATGGYATTRTLGVPHQVHGDPADYFTHERKVTAGHTRAARIARLAGT